MKTGFASSTGDLNLYSDADLPYDMREVISRVHAEVVKILAQPQVRDGLLAQGADIVGNTPEQFADFLKQDYERWARVIQAAGVKPE